MWSWHRILPQLGRGGVLRGIIKCSYYFCIFLTFILKDENISPKRVAEWDDPFPIFLTSFLQEMVGEVWGGVGGWGGGGGGLLRGVDGLRSCEGIEYWEGRGKGLIRAITCLPGLPGTISITKKPEMVVT